jgi:hypothetical protein
MGRGVLAVMPARMEAGAVDLVDGGAWLCQGRVCMCWRASLVHR